MPLCICFRNDVICVFIISANGSCCVRVQISVELPDDIRGRGNIVVIFMNQGEYFTISGNFLFRPIVRFRFLADQCF